MDIDFDSEIRAHLNEVLKLKKPSGVFTASAHTVGTGYDKAGPLNQYQKPEALYDDTYKARYERLEQEFAEFKDRCYCKDIT